MAGVLWIGAWWGPMPSLLVVVVAASDDGAKVGRIAKAITVKIKGSQGGSGVIVEKVGRRYTVLTAWHVIGSNRPGEEVAITTSDSQEHIADSRTMQRLASDVDLGVITFESSQNYTVAAVGDSRQVEMGQSIYVAGFPLPTSAVPVRSLRLLKGDVQANASVAIPNGYQLLYSNPTLEGMSGGAVLNSAGELVGIHGQGETVDKPTEQENVFIKTGTNQAVPIAFFQEFQRAAALLARAATAMPKAAVRPVADAVAALAKSASKPAVAARPIAPTVAAPAPAPKPAPAPSFKPAPAVVAPVAVAVARPQQEPAAPAPAPKLSPQVVAKASTAPPLQPLDPIMPVPSPSKLMHQTRPDTADDYLALARQLFNKRGNEKQIINLMRDSIALKPTALAYFYRAKAKHDSGDVVGAMNDYNEALRLNPSFGTKVKQRGRSTGESISDRAMAMRLAMEKLPMGAAVINKSCQEIKMGPDNYKYRCTVEFTNEGL